MDTNLSSYYLEIFGADEITAPVPQKSVPDLPMLDDATFDLSKVTAAANDFCEQLDRQELIDLLAPAPDVSADVARFSIAPPPAPGFDSMLNKLVTEIMPSAAGMAMLTPETSAGVSKFLGTFTKRAPSKVTRRDISRVMTPHYSHGAWKRWEQMMDAFIGADD